MNEQFDQAGLEAFARIAKARRSVRGFLPKAASQAELESIFNVAQTAPSNCNTQPWLAAVASGSTRDQLQSELQQAIAGGDWQMDFPYEGSYSDVYKTRQYDAANQLYTAMGIERQDKEKRNDAFMRNFAFFDAPHVAFLFLPDGFGIREAGDLGMYAQNLMLAITAAGMASCPMTALSFNARVVKEILEVDVDNKLLFGIAFGYEDKQHDANKARVGRAPLTDVVSFKN